MLYIFIFIYLLPFDSENRICIGHCTNSLNWSQCDGDGHHLQLVAGGWQWHTDNKTEKTSFISKQLKHNVLLRCFFIPTCNLIAFFKKLFINLHSIKIYTIKLKIFKTSRQKCQQNQNCIKLKFST